MSALRAEDLWLAEAVGSDVRGFFMAMGVDLPAGYGEVMVRCFANHVAHRRDDQVKSCSVNTLTGLWCCHGCGQKGNAYQAATALGYTQLDAKRLAKQHGLFREEEKVRLPNEIQIRKWEAALRAKPSFIARLGELKGWSEYAIRRLRLGWDGERITFISRDHKWKKTGIARYLPGGQPKMVSVPGSKRGLFPMPELIPRKRPVFIVEGEPAAVSVWSCGHYAVAVPGANAWKPQMANRLAGRRLIVLPDCDAPGRKLAGLIVGSLPNVQVVDLEPGREDGWDIGDMVLEGGAAVGRLLERLVAWRDARPSGETSPTQ